MRASDRLMRSFRERVYALTCRIPAGKVATYGELASMAGKPQGAREVGWAMGSAPDGVPWWRVVNRLGRISSRPGGVERQAELLRNEGVDVSADGRMDLDRCRWEGE